MYTLKSLWNAKRHFLHHSPDSVNSQPAHIRWEGTNLFHSIPMHTGFINSYIHALQGSDQMPAPLQSLLWLAQRDYGSLSWSTLSWPTGARGPFPLDTTHTHYHRHRTQEIKSLHLMMVPNTTAQVEQEADASSRNRMAKRESLILPQFLFSIVFMCNSGPLPHDMITVFLGPKSLMLHYEIDSITWLPWFFLLFSLP